MNLQLMDGSINQSINHVLFQATRSI